MKFALALIVTVLSFSSHAQDQSESRKKIFNLEKGVAIQGYDPVAYFKLQKAVKGSKEIAIIHQGVTYYFSKPEYRDEFKKNPFSYEPQYGGWCAFAMAKGDKVSIDPETFKIVNNKLYLFYNSYFNNTLKSWNKDENNLKANADKNWTKIFH